MVHPRCYGYEIKCGPRRRCTFRQFSHREKSAQAGRKKQERKRETRERDFVPSISGFSERFAERFREFHSSGFPHFLHLSFLSFPLPRRFRHCGTVRGEEEPSNLANDVLKIPDNVSSLLYDSSLLGNFLNDKFHA